MQFKVGVLDNTMIRCTNAEKNKQRNTMFFDSEGSISECSDEENSSFADENSENLEDDGNENDFFA